MFNPRISIASRYNAGGTTRSTVATISAPIGGWNARDPVSEMPPTDAYVLDNFIPGLQGVVQRQGVTTHATGVTGNFIETLMEYSAGSGAAKLFAADPSKIYNVTASGAVGAAELSSLSNGRWQHLMFSTAGGNFLVCCNGADSVRNYDGTTWTTPAITGVTSSTLINVAAHAQRLWFVQSGTLKIWYLPVLSIAGAATSIDFASICRLGGELVAMATWTRDGGAGMDDSAVFVTSKGEILIYQGTDPSSVTTWSLVGIFKGPPPIGKRCFIKLGADLCYLSVQGVLPLPPFLNQNSAGRAALAITNKISGAFQDAYVNYGTNYGWQVIEYPKKSLLIVNIPVVERATQHQYVMNLQNGSWCRFKNIQANCMALSGDYLYFGGSDGKTYKYATSENDYDDDGEPINSLSIHAFNSFGSVARKSFKMARPLFIGPSSYIPQVTLLTDYSTNLPEFSPTSYDSLGALWGTFLWGTRTWSSGLRARSIWRAITGNGVTAAAVVAANTTRKLTYNAIDIMFETGGPL